MQSEIHFNRDQSATATIRRWLSPTGGAVIDGVRLAVANGIFLVAALILSFVFALFMRLVRLFVSAPSLNPSIVVLLLSIIFAMIVWYRYAIAHRNLAQASGRTLHPDRFGIIAGSPFALLALLLLGSGVFGLFVSVLGVSVGGLSAAVGRLFFALLFGLLALASIFNARVAMRE